MASSTAVVPREASPFPVASPLPATPNPAAGMFEEMRSLMHDMTRSHRQMMDQMLSTFGLPRDPLLHSEPFPVSLLDFERLPTALEELERGFAPSLGSDGTAVMFSAQQFYNSADPSQNYARFTAAQAAGPNGLAETRTAVRDGRGGVERVEVKRQLGEQFAHLQRQRTLTTGQETLQKTTHNIPNEDAEGFDVEWRRQAVGRLPLYRAAPTATVPPASELLALGNPAAILPARAPLPIAAPAPQPYAGRAVGAVQPASEVTPATVASAATTPTVGSREPFPPRYGAGSSYTSTVAPPYTHGAYRF